MAPVKVLHIYRGYFPESQGGLEESIRQLCLATQAYCVHNTVFALARHPEPAVLHHPEARVVRSKSLAEIASCNIGGLDAVQKCRQAADEADVIQIHYPWPFADVLLPLVRRKKQPVVVTYVSDIVRQRAADLLYSPLRNLLLGSASRIVASSANYVRTSPVLHQHSQKLSVIPHCMGPLPEPDATLVERWKERLGGDFFLFIGVLRYYKGLEFLIRAAPDVGRPIVLIGDGPKRVELQKEVALSGAGNVVFLGALPDADKLAVLRLCRGVVFPSHLRSEAFGMTLLEGAQASKPLVSCEIGTGTSWINLHEETGLVVPSENPPALAQALNTLAGDDALCQRMGQAAHARWKQLFSPASVGQSYRTLYDEVLQA